MAPPWYQLLLCVLGLACIEASLDAKGWTDAINKSFRRFLVDFRAKDWDACADWYKADAHFLSQGSNVAVGRDAIAEQYRSIDSARGRDFDVVNLRVTSLRYYSESWAVAEYAFFDNGDGKVGLGVSVFEMEDGELKYDTDIYYEV